MGNFWQVIGKEKVRKCTTANTTVHIVPSVRGVPNIIVALQSRLRNSRAPETIKAAVDAEDKPVMAAERDRRIP